MDNMLTTTQAIWRSSPQRIKALNGADEWTAEPTHWCPTERRWRWSVALWCEWITLIIRLFNAAELQHWHSRMSTPVRIWLLTKICAMLKGIWIAVNIVSKLYHQALALGKMWVLLMQLKWKRISCGGPISRLKSCVFKKLYLKFCWERCANIAPWCSSFETWLSHAKIPNSLQQVAADTGQVFSSP